MEKRYLINGEVYKGSETPNIHWSDSSNKLMLWKQSLVKLDCSEPGYSKIIHRIDNSIVENPIIDITSITTVKDGKVYFKEAESEYIKCGDCNKFYLCTNCGAQCGSEGHFIEKSESNLWEIAFKEADIYAQKQYAKDREENNIKESGYWFWRDNYLKQRFTIKRNNN